MIIDWFWTTIIFFIVFGSLSSMYGSRQSRLKAVAEAQKPRDLRLCSCGHGGGKHSNGGCVADVKRKTFAPFDSDDPDYEWVRCGCMHYDGTDPEAIVRGWSPPEITP